MLTPEQRFMHWQLNRRVLTFCCWSNYNQFHPFSLRSTRGDRE